MEKKMLLQQCRTNDGTQTCVLLDEPLHAANVGSILRQAAVLQSPTQPDGVSAVLLSRTAANARAAEAIFSEKFLKNVLRISLAERQALEHATRLVILPTGPLEPLKQLRQQGFVLLALENLEDDRQGPWGGGCTLGLLAHSMETKQANT
eukprot:g30322.t1